MQESSGSAAFHMPDPVCPYCGEDWEASDFSHWGIDILKDPARGDRFVVARTCCEGMQEEIERSGYEGAYGRKLEDVVREILGPGFDLIRVTDPGDSTVIGRLVVHDPTESVGEGRAASPPGWRSEILSDVAEHHRHHDAPPGWKFGVAVYNQDLKVGVATVGRPVSRVIQQAEPGTLEVTRVATWGHPELRKNASSKLYAAAADRAKALGYDKMITYTMADEETGHSVRAAGFLPVHRTKGGQWSTPARRRETSPQSGAKIRWERGLTRSTREAVERASEKFQEGKD